MIDTIVHVRNLMEKLNLPKGARMVFTALEERIAANPAFAAKMEEYRQRFMFSGEELSPLLPELDETAKEFGEVNYTLHFVFLLNCTDILLDRYREAGISEDIYWDTMDDLRCKLMECIECKGVWGTFVAGWNNGFFKMKRFALGRFQFEHSKFDRGAYDKGGVHLRDGDKVINFHIPSSGKPLSPECRFDSYKKAFDFYKDEFGGGPVPFVCGSWLLYPGQRDFLPTQCANMLGFMSDFDIIGSEDRETFGNDWRVFGRYAGVSPELLPRDTALRRAYADRLTAGLPTGSGFGIIVFDGEKITNK